MAASAPQNAGEPITGINVTPLVDITLVLLIIFMVTAKLIVSHRSLNLDLPKAASGEAAQEIFSVSLHPSGALQVDGRHVEGDAQLLELAGRARRGNKDWGSQDRGNTDLRAVIQADGAVPHRRVMHVLDLLRQAGFTKVAFAVVPPTTRAQR